MVATALIAPVASADSQTTTSASAAHGQVVWAEGLGLDVAGAGTTLTEWVAAGPNEAVRDELDVELLGGETLNLGSVALPILGNSQAPGLLDLGSAGAVSSYSHSPSETQSISASGLITEGGALDFDAAGEPGFTPAQLDVSALLEQLLGTAVRDTVLDTATVDLGAVGARAEKDGTAIDREYLLSELDLEVHSNLVEGLSTTLDSSLTSLVAPLNGAIGTGGVLSQAISGLSAIVDDVDLLLVRLDSDPSKSTVELTGVDDLIDGVVQDALRDPIANGDGSIVVDLVNGTVRVDLAQVLIASDSAYAGLDINSLPANTDVLTEDVISAITDGVTDAILDSSSPDSLISKVESLLQERIWDVGVKFNINASGYVGLLAVQLPLAEADITIEGTLAQFTGYEGASLGSGDITTDLDLLGVLPVGDLLNPLVTPLINVITSTVTAPLLELVTDDVLGGVQSTVVEGLLQPLVGELVGALDPLLDQLLTLTINEQPEAGDFGTGSSTVRALAISLLPVVGSDAVKVELGSATVKAADDESPENSADARAAASASASATADDDSNASAQAAAQAAAYGDQSSQASVEGTAQANAASQAAAQASVEAGASTNASQDATTDTNAAAQAAAEGGTADNSADSKASASASAQANANASASAQAAASSDAYSVGSADASANAGASSTASTSTNASASSNASANANANASASASADSNANAAAKAAAMADNSTSASAKATANAQAAAQTAANASASNNASAQANGSAQAAARAAANSQADSDSNASASARANSNASAAAKAAAIANASSNASGENPNPNTSKCLTPRSRSVFLDTPTNHKFYKEIDWMHCMGYTTGIKRSGGIDYGPQLRLSREAMAAFIFRMEAPKNYRAPLVSPFADMKPGDKFYREIVWMYEEGLSTGIKNPEGGKPNYGPKLRLSREAMAAFIYRLEAPRGYVAPAKSQMLDMKRGDKFYTEISWMVDEQLSTGIKVEDGREFWPKSRLSREAMAAFIYRLVNSYRA
ncbi:choice-of-anchor G family protein [Leucobacter sp.]